MGAKLEDAARSSEALGASHLNIVILAEEVTTALVYEVQEELGPRWNQK